MKKLQGLAWSPAWVTHLGCVAGCLDYLGIGLSRPWLWGGTGHAFVINIHPELCPSGPTAWNTDMLHDLAPNLGYTEWAVFAHKGMGEDAFAQGQRDAWDRARAWIDGDKPCYGWELAVPEFYVIQGYDEIGYYYSGARCDAGTGPKHWQELGDTGIGSVEVFGVGRGQAASPEKTVRDALQSALHHASRPAEWIFGDYESGLRAFDIWADALEQGKANRFGLGYNTAVWSECRSLAVGFLREAKAKLPQAAPALDEGIAAYGDVAAALTELGGLFPFGPEGEQVRSAEGAEFVRRAGEAERRGLDALRAVVEALG
jgi:hypothetical protein